MTKYRYANSILWGPTYDQASGMHIIEAADDAEAFEKANRCDKNRLGHSFLQRQDAAGRWRFLPDLNREEMERSVAFSIFQSGGREVFDLGAETGLDYLDGIPGRVYANDLYIERHDGGLCLTIENCSYSGTQAELERILFDWSCLGDGGDDHHHAVYTALDTGGR